MNSTHKPVRNIVNRSGGVLRGFCNVAGVQIPFEGPLEEQFLQQIRLSSRVRSVRSQPMKLRPLVEGIRKLRTPDFLVETIDGPVVIECKPEWKFLQAETRAHLAVASAEVHRAGLPYLVVTERHLPVVASEIAGTLARYVLPPGADRAAVHSAQAMRDALLLKLPLAFEAAMSLGLSETDLYVLIANRFVHLDFTQPLLATSAIQATRVRFDQDAASMLYAADGILADTHFSSAEAEVIQYQGSPWDRTTT